MSNDMLIVSLKGNSRKEYPPSVPDTVRKEKPLMLSWIILWEWHKNLDSNSIAWEIITVARIKLHKALLGLA